MEDRPSSKWGADSWVMEGEERSSSEKRER
jgi:hypothetical protein